MSLSDLKFIFYFLPLFMLVYAVAGVKLRGIVLITGSLVFYYFGAGWFDTALLAAVIVINYFIAGRIEMNSGRVRKLLLILALVLNFGLLLYYKYAGYFSLSISICVS